MVARMKVKGAPGMKSDNVAYDSIAEALVQVPACVARARAMLNAMTDACLGVATPIFATPAGHPRLRTLVQ